VRITAKTLRYAIGLSQRFYPDNELENASEWLKGIQDRVGAWHDEMTLSESARETFSNSRAPRDTRAIAFLRNIKKEEIAMAESARNFIFSIRTTSEYQRLRRVLSASVYAMTNGDDSAVLATDSITGPIE